VLVLTDLTVLSYTPSGSAKWMKHPFSLPTKPRSPVLASDAVFAGKREEHPAGEELVGAGMIWFLKMKKTNDFPKGSRSLVEFALSIEDQENGKDRKYPGSRFNRNLLDELVDLDARLSWHVLNFFVVVVGKCRQVLVL
jgi:hypothetical protein